MRSSGGAISNIPIKKGTNLFVDLAICKLDFEPSKKKSNTLVWLKQGSVDSEIVQNISIKHPQSISLGDTRHMLDRNYSYGILCAPSAH